MQKNTKKLFSTCHLIGAAIVLLIANSHSQAASFNCRNALESYEHIICKNKQLSRYDREMSIVYNYLKRKNSQYNLLQQHWLKNVRNKCQIVECLIKTYELRLNELKNSANCKIDETSLHGKWRKLRGESFEEMLFLKENGFNRFGTSLHGHFEMDGYWEFQNCFLIMRHSHVEKLTYHYFAKSIKGRRLVLEDIIDKDFSDFIKEDEAE